MVALYRKHARRGNLIYAVVKYGFGGNLRPVNSPTILESVFYGNIVKRGQFADCRSVQKIFRSDFLVERHIFNVNLSAAAT